MCLYPYILLSQRKIYGYRQFLILSLILFKKSNFYLIKKQINNHCTCLNHKKYHEVTKYSVE